MPLKTYTLRERPELEDEFERFAQAGWPRFLRQRDELGCGQYWPELFGAFADFQFVLFDGDHPPRSRPWPLSRPGIKAAATAPRSSGA
jgi:hypothetical protein